MCDCVDAENCESYTRRWLLSRFRAHPRILNGATLFAGANMGRPSCTFRYCHSYFSASFAGAETGVFPALFMYLNRYSSVKGLQDFGMG